MEFAMSSSSPPQGAQAALRAIRLLKLFTPLQADLTLAEVSRQSGLNKTTVHRLLSALRSESFIEKSPLDGRYRLGPALMALGVQALSSNDLRLRARPFLMQLAKQSGETATLEVPVDDSMLILDEVSGSHFLGAAGNIGTRWPLHATSTGKAVIAFDDAGVSRLDVKLDALTPQTITELDQLRQQLGDIRRCGYAETVDELEEGFSGVAAVVRGGAGEVLGALSICGPTQRLSAQRRAQFGATLCKVAEDLQPRGRRDIAC
jgi:DNA-binding IclR family transcriptional regulator